MPNNTTSILRFPWDSKMFGDRDAISMIWYFFLAILGSTFNALAAFTLAMMRKTRLDQYWFMLLATTDFLLSSCNGAVKAIRHVRFWREGRQYYATASECLSLGFSNYVFLGTVNLILVAIAIDRCLIIIKQVKYVSFTQRYLLPLASSSSVLIVSLPIIALLVPYFNKGAHFYFESEQATCTMETNIYKYIIVGSFIYIPLLLMIVMYTSILIYYFRQQRKTVDVDAGNRTSKISKKDLKLIQTMATIVFVYVLCYVPYTIVAFKRIITYYSLRITGMLVYTVVITDPLVYFVLNENMRNAIFFAIRCKRFNQGGLAGTSGNAGS